VDTGFGINETPEKPDFCKTLAAKSWPGYEVDLIRIE